jgi:hypothetical protein
MRHCFTPAHLIHAEAELSGYLIEGDASFGVLPEVFA